jgi:copper transport protein
MRPFPSHALALALALAAVIALFGGEALAHAVLLESRPGDGQRLESPPAELTLRFDEPVEVRSLGLVGSDGTRRRLDPGGGGTTLSAPLPPLPQGTYVATWRLVSADGHPIAGSLVFGVGAAADPGAAPTATGTPLALLAAHGLARAASYAGSLAGAGALLALALLGGNAAFPARHARRLALLGAMLGAGATVAATALGHAVLAEGVPDPGALARDTAAALGGAAPALRLLGLGAVAAGALLRPVARVAGPAGALAVAASYAVTGHTAPLGLPPVTVALLLHLLGVAFWLGSLPPLLRATRDVPADALRPLMSEFSAVAVVLVPLLALSGLGLAWVLVGDLPGLTGTGYGALLAGKALLVSAMLGLAALNRRRLTPALGRDADAPRRLRRSIAAEIAVAAAVLVVTATLTSVPPPAAHGARSWLRDALEGPLTLSAEAGPLRATLSLATSRPGWNALDLRLEGGDAARATLRLSSAGLGVEGIARPMERVGPGAFRHEGPELATPGDWTVEVDLLVDDFTRHTARFAVPLGQAGHGHGHGAQ